MPHSYVAKPAAVEPSPDYPTGWNPNWPFPGPPYPPGYAPSSPTGFDSDDDKEPKPPIYRIAYSAVLDGGGVNVTFTQTMAAFGGSTTSPFAWFATPEFQFANVIIFEPSGYLDTSFHGANFEVSGVGGTSGLIESGRSGGGHGAGAGDDGIVRGTSYLLEIWMGAVDGGFQVTLDASIYRTPWIPLPLTGGFELGEEALITAYQKVYNNQTTPTPDGDTTIECGWLNIWRTATGIVVNEQWAVEVQPEYTPSIQYLV